MLRELRNADSPERVGATAGKRCKADHKEVKTREGHHVDGKLAKIRVELARESKARRDTRHDSRDQVVEVTVRGVRQLERAHTDIVESLVVDTESLVRVLNKLMNRQGGVVGFDDCVRHLGRRDDRERGHHPVWEFLSDLGNKKGAHTGAGTATKRVGDLESLEAVAALSLPSHDIENLIDKLSTLGIMTLGPVVASTGLTEDEVVGTEKLTKGAGADSVHGAGLEIDKDSARDILVSGCLETTQLDARTNDHFRCSWELIPR